VAVASLVACTNPQTVLTQLLEARRLASELHVQFTRAAEAANRAVMADTDEASAAAADEARRAVQIVDRDVQALRGILESLRYGEDLRHLNGFNSRFDEYRRLDDEILPLAVENTNLKAQRLSFGPARDAANAFQTSIDAAVRAGRRKDACCAEVVAARARAALFEIQVMYAPHIAEAEDAAMTQMEGRMAASEALARKALDELRTTLSREAAPQLGAAAAALDRFMALHQEIITLSRRNSEVRSLALSLGRKRVVTAECEAQLQALEETLAKHEFTATR
jgi:negative regulator of replication initiation